MEESTDGYCRLTRGGKGSGRMMTADLDEHPTLPDILACGLKVVFVGINPSIFSVEHGHYFARPANRFWPALSNSRLSAAARRRLGRADLLPEHDASLLVDGFGFTDVVKRPTSSANDLHAADFAAYAPDARRRIEQFAPGVACFQGATALRPFLRFGLGVTVDHLDFGLQAIDLGATRLFMVPNPSPANAKFRLEDLVFWFDRLAGVLTEV